MIGTSNFQSIVSGSGTVTSSTSGTADVMGVITDHDFGFAPVSTKNHDVATGTVISWSGDLISGTPYSDFIEGVYTTRLLLNGIVIDSDYILTIGPNGGATVPEPSTMLLFAFGILGSAGIIKKKYKS